MNDRLKAMEPHELRRLRDLMRSVQPASGEGLPHDRIASLADALNDLGTVTIDYTAAESLGHPVVVLREFSPGLEGLSPREDEVARLVAQGLANKQIAQRLNISIATTKEHVHNILEKTGLPNRAAIAAAVR